MTEYKELAARAREAAVSIRNDGTPAQVGLSEDECLDIASAIEALEAELDELLGQTFKASADAAEYHRDQAITMWDDERKRTAAAEARCKRLEEALRPFAGEKLPSSKRSEISRNEWGLRCLMSPLEIARQAARLTLQENTNGG